MGPPTHSPCRFRCRNRTARVISAYLMTIPSRAAAQSQNTAPYPPMAMA